MRVPPVSVDISKYVATVPVGLPSALRVCEILIQLLLVWKTFRPTWAYVLPGRRCHRRARRGDLRDQLEVTIRQRLTEDRGRAGAREVERVAAEREHEVAVGTLGALVPVVGVVGWR